MHSRAKEKHVLLTCCRAMSPAAGGLIDWCLREPTCSSPTDPSLCDCRIHTTLAGCSWSYHLAAALLSSTLIALLPLFASAGARSL
jgi:hypothetical protein